MFVKIIAVLLLNFNVYADDYANVKINTIKVSPGLHMLIGAGGNIGVLSGSDGVFLIDDQFAPLTTKIKNAVKKISTEPIRYVFNTHWHFDHTGGNENFGKSGSVIVAHDNVRKLLSKDQVLKVFNKRIKAKSPEGLPVITFNSEMSFHLNNEHVHVIHVKNAHTNGDSIIHFKKANAYHMGDTFFHGKFPFIDTQHGGTLSGVVDALSFALKNSNSKTKFIPGHGTLATQSELKAYLTELKKIISILRKLAKKGMSLDEVLTKKPLAKYDATWGSGFMKTDQFIKINYHSLK